MINAITYSISDFCHTAILDPHCEGVARINRAIEGVNLHHIQYRELGMKERLVDLILGISLLIPLLNAVVLICMRTFGSSEPLSQNLVPQIDEPWIEAEQACRKEIVPELLEIERLEMTAPVIREYQIRVQEEDEEPFISDTKIETHANKFVISGKSVGKASEAHFDLNWKLKSVALRDDKRKIDIVAMRSKDKIITVRGSKEISRKSLKHQ